MNGPYKISKERAMSISLDEYIEECRMFKKSENNSENLDDTLSSKDDNISTFIKVWDNNTLEEIIRNTNKGKCELSEPWVTNYPSQQWRLHRHKDKSRPNDMPPIVSIEHYNTPSICTRNRKNIKRFFNHSGETRKNARSLKQHLLANTQIWCGDPFALNNTQNEQINSKPIVSPNNYPVNDMVTYQNFESLNNKCKQITHTTESSCNISNTNNNCVQIVTSIANVLLKQVQKEVSDYNTNNINKYDINIQKQLSVFQNKPFVYKCPGGGVISQDGPGVDDCVIIPKQTGVSMNQRFA